MERVVVVVVVVVVVLFFKTQKTQTQHTKRENHMASLRKCCALGRSRHNFFLWLTTKFVFVWLITKLTMLLVCVFLSLLFMF